VDLTKSLPDSEQMAKFLVEYAKKNKSKDNISVLVVRFKK